LVEGLKVSHCVPLKLAQPLIHSAPDEPRTGSPIKGKEGLAIIIKHHIGKSLPIANTRESVFIIFEVKGVKAKQATVGLTTQRDRDIGNEIFDMIERKKDGNRRAIYLKP
jgi:hypothetical protein